MKPVTTAMAIAAAVFVSVNNRSPRTVSTLIKCHAATTMHSAGSSSSG